MHIRSSHPSRRRGFTLAEILIVVAILVLMISIAIPAIGGYPTSQQVSSEADNLTSQLAYARLIAVSSGRPVEVRFYREPVTKAASGDLQFRALQVMVQDEEEIMRPDGRLSRFSGKVILSGNPEFSSILDGEAEGPDPLAADLGNRAAEELTYKSLRFLPDGSTNLGKSGGYWSLTIQNWKPGQSETLPADFVTLQVDPFNGRVRRYEPGY